LQSFEINGLGSEKISLMYFNIKKVQDKLEKKGIPCTLITGQERVIRTNAKVLSCTVECTNLSDSFDIALIVKKWKNGHVNFF